MKMRNSGPDWLGMLWWMTALPSVKTPRSFLIKVSSPPGPDQTPRHLALQQHQQPAVCWAGSAEIYFRFAVRKFTFRQLRCIFGVEGVGCYLFLAQFCFNINFAMGAVGERHRNLISSWNPIKAPQLLLFCTNLHLKENVILTPQSPVAVGEKLPQSKSEGGRKVGSEILVCCINLHLEAKSPSFCH